MNKKIDVKKKLLIDVCCGVCFAGVLGQLDDIYDIVVYWHNANIYPKNEYLKRLASQKKAFSDIKMVINNDNWKKNHKIWLDYVESEKLAKEPEGGERCIKCYEYRFNQIANYAKKNNFDLFASTLTVSPHKKAKIINNIAKNIASEYQVDFFEADFKKKDGFKKANLKARELGIYRQNYCGCEFSIPK